MTNKLLSLFWSLVAVVIVMISSLFLWFFLSTDIVLSPKSIHYSGKEVTFVRTTPFGNVWARWATEIRVGSTGRECHSGYHMSEYQVEDDDTVSYTLGDWADPCLEEGPPLVIVNNWQAFFLGVIPLKPARMVSIIEIRDPR